MPGIPECAADGSPDFIERFPQYPYLGGSLVKAAVECPEYHTSCRLWNPV